MEYEVIDKMPVNTMYRVWFPVKKENIYKLWLLKEKTVYRPHVFLNAFKSYPVPC